jgi:hypothetical protein
VIKTNTMRGYFKVSEDGIRALEFGANGEFNGTRCSSIYRSSLKRQLTDSFEITVEQYGERHSVINELKITNQSMLTWDDHWFDAGTGKIIDPRISTLDLRKNNLVYVNINTPRSYLKVLNVSQNSGLRVLHLHECPLLEELNISECKELENISLGINKSLKTINAKGCNMSSSAMEQLLRDFTPVITASANVKGVGAFRKQYETLLDLRGNTIDWSNKKIASKIRLLLTNNWIVKWDNNPPTEVMPIQLYRFFVESEIGTRS